MFELSRSIKRFSADPAWEVKEGLEANRTPLERGGYPYSLRGSGGGQDVRVVSGTVAGYPAHLAHTLVYGGTGGFRPFSSAVLELRFTYPDTVVTPRRLAIRWATPHRPPFRWGGELVTPLPGSSLKSEVYPASAVPEFGLALLSPEVVRLTLEADFGWRLAGRQVVGWTDGERPLDQVHTMAERLAAIVAAFPLDARAWARPV